MCLLVFILLVASLPVASDEGERVKVDIVTAEVQARAEYTIHDPIDINGEADFKTQAEEEGWEGAGTENEPYIIDGYEINGSDSKLCIRVNATSDHFIIRNCLLYDCHRGNQWWINSYYHPKGIGIELSSVDNGRIENNTITDCTTGIKMRWSDDLIINNNDITFTDDGIEIESGERVKIANNNCSFNDKGIFCSGNKALIEGNELYKNSYKGIEVSYCDYVTVNENTVIGNGVGIQLWWCQANITFNSIFDNKNDAIEIYNSNDAYIHGNEIIGKGINFRDGALEYLNTHTITENTVNGRSLIYWANVKGHVLNEDAGQVIAVNCSGITIGSQNAQGPIKVYFCEDVTIKDCVSGIEMLMCERITLTNNKCNNDAEIGIRLTYCQDAVLRNNELTNRTLGIGGLGVKYWDSHDIDTSNTVDGKPVYYIKNQHGGTVPTDAEVLFLVNCTDMVVRDLQIRDSAQSIELVFCSNNLVMNNSLKNTSGILLLMSEENTLAFNTFWNCTMTAISMGNSQYNSVKYNRIEGNLVGLKSITFSYSYDPGGDDLDDYSYGGGSVIHHNNFIDNFWIAQPYATDFLWNDTKGEGNYYDDYPEKVGGAVKKDGNVWNRSYPFFEEEYYLDELKDDHPLVNPADTEPTNTLDTTTLATTGENVRFGLYIANSTGMGEVYVRYRFETNKEFENMSMNGAASGLWKSSLAIPEDQMGELIYQFQYKDQYGNWTTLEEKSVRIIDNDAPLAGVQQDMFNLLGEGTIYLDASESTDNIGIVNYTWGINNNRGDYLYLYGKNVSVYFNESGDYRVYLDVYDADGNMGRDYIHVYVEPILPNNITVTVGPVRDTDNNTLEGVEVIVNIDDSQYKGYTNETGYAEVVIPRPNLVESYTIGLYKEGYEYNEYDATVYPWAEYLEEPPPLEKIKGDSGPDEQRLLMITMGLIMGICIFFVIIFVTVLLIALVKTSKKREKAAAEAKKEEAEEEKKKKSAEKKKQKKKPPKKEEND